MKELSRIATEVRASTTMAIDAMFKQMKADGIDVIGFGAGEPDFNTPDEIKAAGEKRTIPQYDNSGKLMIELHEIMSDTLDYSLDCSAGTVQQDYIMLRPIVMTFRTSTYAQARQIVDRLCSSENISQISDMNMNTYTEGRNSGTVETTLVITYFEIMS